jgi:hypothetical protein
MSRYRMPVMFTVELVVPGRGNIVWRYEGDFAKQESETMFKVIAGRTRGIVDSPGTEHHGEWTLGVNLVMWSKHPSHGDAEGFILDQKGWSEE